MIGGDSGVLDSDWMTRTAEWHLLCYPDTMGHGAHMSVSRCPLLLSQPIALECISSNKRRGKRKVKHSFIWCLQGSYDRTHSFFISLLCIFIHLMFDLSDSNAAVTGGWSWRRGGN